MGIIYSKKGKFFINIGSIEYIGYEFIDFVKIMVNNFNRDFLDAKLKEYKIEIMVDLERSKMKSTKSNIIEAIRYDLEYLRLGNYKEQDNPDLISRILIRMFKDDYKIPYNYDKSSIIFEKRLDKYEKVGYEKVDVSIEKELLKQELNILKNRYKDYSKNIKDTKSMIFFRTRRVYGK